MNAVSGVQIVNWINKKLDDWFQDKNCTTGNLGSFKLLATERLHKFDYSPDHLTTFLIDTSDMLRGAKLASLTLQFPIGNTEKISNSATILIHESRRNTNISCPY